MKKFVCFFMLFLCLFLCGCNQENYVPKFEVFDENLEQNYNFSFDKVSNVISMPSDSKIMVIKLTPPINIDDLSTLKVWLNGVEFMDTNKLYSNGDDIFIEIDCRQNFTNILTVKWNNKTKAQDFYIKV